MSLEQLFAGTTVNVPAMVNQLEQTAGSLGLAFGKRTMTYNSRLAQEMGLWAEEQGCGTKFHHAAFLTYFRDGKNLALPEVLIALARQCGLDDKKATEVIRKRSFSAAVDAHWNEAGKLGITAVPTLLFGHARTTGFQAYQQFRNFILAGGAQLRSP